MIQPLSISTTAADFKLPRQITLSDARIEAFGRVYEANRTQFATRETAEALASLLGGKVSDLSEQWGAGKVSPLYQIDLSGGVSLNAGLLADRFQRHGTAAAIQMTQEEVAHILTPVTNVVASAAFRANSASVSPSPVGSSAAPGSLTLKATSATEKSKLADAAIQFESLLMAQILKSATPEGEDGLLSGAGDSSTQSIYQMALESFAAVLGQQGGLGLAGTVTDQLKLSHPTTCIRG